MFPHPDQILSFILEAKTRSTGGTYIKNIRKNHNFYVVEVGARGFTFYISS